MITNSDILKIMSQFKFLVLTFTSFKSVILHSPQSRLVLYWKQLQQLEAVTEALPVARSKHRSIMVNVNTVYSVVFDP